MYITAPYRKPLWVIVAEVYSTPNEPWAVYADDRDIGRLHAAVLAANFHPGVNELSVMNPWATDLFIETFPLRIPSEASLADFPDGMNPYDVATAIGYNLTDPHNPLAVPDSRLRSDLPEWVQAYIAWLEEQVRLYGRVISRNLRPRP